MIIAGATGPNTGVSQSLGTTAGNSYLLAMYNEGPTLAIIDAHDGTLLQDLNVKGAHSSAAITGSACCVRCTAVRVIVYNGYNRMTVVLCSRCAVLHCTRHSCNHICTHPYA